MTEIFLFLLGRKNSWALRRIFGLTAPASPRSPVSTSARIRSSGRLASSGCCGSAMRDMIERSIRASSLAYGRAASAASWARRNMAAETNFIARVICWVFFTERMRRRKSRSVGIVLRQAAVLILCRGHGSRKALLERIQSGLDFGLNAVVQGFLRRDVFQY